MLNRFCKNTKFKLQGEACRCLKGYFLPALICLVITAKSDISIAQNSTLKQSAQSGRVNGTVVDEFNVPLQGVHVSLKRKADSTSTNINGQFSINAAAGDILTFSCKNFYVREVKIKGGDTLSVHLIPAYLKSAEKADVLYGTTDRASVLGSISTVYTNQLTTTPASLYTYALPGQLPGLYTQQVSGFTAPPTGGQTQPDFIGNVVQHNNYSPNDNNEISLSLRGQTPITIIDNVQREISSIDPESIESISVLKDGLSTILLGNNSSRGVLLITTKRPEAGKPRISLTAQTGLQQPLGLPTPLPA
ncbi:MAG TPA: carboxypeptidase-like regulatory domain-containing protein, partial [Mucilaginibacter sp.]|nr:carboxypeptidase-like regulatory domain-containing protein [Mucilaginibacter sp.]